LVHRARWIEPPDELVPWSPRIERAHLTPVVSDAYVIASRVDDRPKPAGPNRPAVGHGLSHARREAIPSLRSRGQEQELVMREADQGIRPSALDHRVRELVRRWPDSLVGLSHHKF